MMLQEQWDTIKQCARMEPMQQVPVGLIVDSPWIPGYLGISMLDYLSNPQVWLQANLQVAADFPTAIFLPGFWPEYGMAAEPSGFGCKLRFFEESTPQVYHLFEDIASGAGLVPPNPLSDGLMPFILNTYRWAEPRAQDAGHVIKIVAARGPLALATHLMGVTNFLLALKLDPTGTHKLLEITSETVINWLEAQADALSSPEGVMVLDDIVGFLSPDDYLAFAHPYLKRIYAAFPQAVKFFHNDTHNAVSYPYLADLGVQVFNFTHLQPMEEMRDLVGAKVCLMGNVAPLSVLAQGSAAQTAGAARACLEAVPDGRGLLLSAGGGVSPGTPGENIRALLEAAARFSPKEDES